jgi:hypothetical protein
MWGGNLKSHTGYVSQIRKRQSPTNLRDAQAKFAWTLSTRKSDGEWQFLQQPQSHGGSEIAKGLENILEEFRCQHNGRCC